MIRWKVDRVDQTADDVLEYLRPLGEALDIPRRLIAALSDYMRTYMVDGTPDFSGDSYFERATDEAETPKAEQLKLHVVDSYSMSVSLCLATLGFLQVYRESSVRSQRMQREVDELEKLSSKRLTAAMVGLLRSFTINTFAADRPARRDAVPDDQSGQYRVREPRARPAREISPRSGPASKRS